MEFYFRIWLFILYVNQARPFTIQNDYCTITANHGDVSTSISTCDSICNNAHNWTTPKLLFIGKPKSKEIYFSFIPAKYSYNVDKYEVRLFSSSRICPGTIYNVTCIDSKRDEKIYITYHNVPPGNYCLDIAPLAGFCPPCGRINTWIVEIEGGQKSFPLSIFNLDTSTSSIHFQMDGMSGDESKNLLIYQLVGVLLSLLFLVAIVCFIFRIIRRRKQSKSVNPRKTSDESKDMLLNYICRQRSGNEIEQQIQKIINSKPLFRLFILHCVGDENVDDLVKAFVKVLEENFFCQIIYCEVDREITDIQRKSNAIWNLQNIRISDRLIIIETDYACKIQQQLITNQILPGRNHDESSFLHGLVSIKNSQQSLADSYSQLLVVKFDSSLNRLQSVADHCRFFLPFSLPDLFINLHKNVRVYENVPEMTSDLTTEEIRQVWNEKSSSYRIFMQKFSTETI